MAAIPEPSVEIIDRQVMVMRHADAAPLSAAGDRQRPLTPLGAHRAADRASEVRTFDPQLVLVSPARRTLETLEQLNLHTADVVETPEIYNATTEDLLSVLVRQPHHSTRILLLGHQPAVQQLAILLSRDATANLPFAPAAIVVLSTQRPWAELGPRSCDVVSFHP